jgi:hypothetical protein
MLYTVTNRRLQIKAFLLSLSVGDFFQFVIWTLVISKSVVVTAKDEVNIPESEIDLYLMSLCCYDE